MRTIVKILIAFDVPDDPAARMRFREVAAALVPHIPPGCEVREFKMIEDGTGRLLEKTGLRTED
jgi:hypothetical protein